MDSEKPKKDWSLQPKRYPGTPLPPMDVVMRAREAMKPKPNPYAVMHSGLQEGDELAIDWLDSTTYFAGCRIEAFRGGRRLKWLPNGPLRDSWGKCLYAPYLKEMKSIEGFAEMLATVSGYVPLQVNEEARTKRRFALQTVPGLSQRLIAGDHINFANKGKSFEVKRMQLTADRNLYNPSQNEGFLLRSNVEYLSMSHHPTVLARVMAEANGFLVHGLGGDKFLVQSKA